MPEIRNIIFDLGGVIINLDTPATIKAFETLGAGSFQRIYTQLQQVNLFDLFDKGLIAEVDFRKQLNELIGLQPDDEAFGRQARATAQYPHP